MSFQEFVLWVKTDALPAGFAGSLVASMSFREGKVAALRRMIIGTLMAYYMGPIGVVVIYAVLGKVDIQPENAAASGGFVMGVLGTTLVDAILKAARIKYSGDSRENNTP